MQLLLDQVSKSFGGKDFTGSWLQAQAAVKDGLGRDACHKTYYEYCGPRFLVSLCYREPQINIDMSLVPTSYPLIMQLSIFFSVVAG